MAYKFGKKLISGREKKGIIIFGSKQECEIQKEELKIDHSDLFHFLMRLINLVSLLCLFAFLFYDSIPFFNQMPIPIFKNIVNWTILTFLASIDFG